MIEALACGTPVAAFPVAGPIDIVTPQVGALSEDLARAIDAARCCDRTACAAYGASYSLGSGDTPVPIGAGGAGGRAQFALRSSADVLNPGSLPFGEAIAYLGRQGGRSKGAAFWS